MINLAFDVAALEELMETLETAGGTISKSAAQSLAGGTWNYIVEQAQSKLRTRRKLYLDALSIQEADDGAIVIKLDASAGWIEDGFSSRSLLPFLLASPKAKTAKDGHKYLSVPFEHNKRPQDQTPYQKQLKDRIASALKQIGVSISGIEMKVDGTPRLGLVRSLDISTVPIKTAEGPGQGRGSVGQVKQGWTGIPFLEGIRVYQKKVTDKNGEETTKRSVVTFRMASSKFPDRWTHPGLEPIGIFKDAQKWAETQLDTMLPELVNQVLIQLT